MPLPGDSTREHSVNVPSISLSISGSTIETAHNVQSNNQFITNYHLTSEYQQRLLPDDKYFENSRGEDVEFVENWVETSLESILWIRGAAATGKSTILRRLLSNFRHKSQIGTFQFFPVACRLDPLDVIKRMVYEMSISYPGTLPRARPLPSDTTLEEHFTRFILDPLRLMFTNKPLLILIDGVDQYVHGPRLLNTLTNVVYPCNIKVIFTGRPTEELTFWFETSRFIKKVTSLELGGVRDEIMSKYLTQRLCTRRDWRSRDGLPTQENIDTLVEKAAGYIGWAAFAANLICHPAEPEPDEVLKDILKSLPTLDSLYSLVLEPLSSSPERSRQVLGIVMVIERSLSAEVLDRLTYAQGLPAREVCNRLRILQTGNYTTPMSKNFHSSVVEFLRDPSRCDPSYFPVSPEVAHLLLFRSCAELIGSHFRTQPPHTRLYDSTSYASDFWPIHAVNTVKPLTRYFSRQLREEIEMFLSKCGTRWVSSQSIAWGGSPMTELYGNNGLEQLRWLAHEANRRGWGLSRRRPIWLSRMFVAIQTIVLRLAEDGKRDADLYTLGSLLEIRYERSWLLEDLDLAITTHLESLAMRPICHPDRDSSLTSIGYNLCKRHEFRGSLWDLNEAIRLHREAIDLRPPGHLQRAFSLANLGHALLVRYEQQGDVSDLNDAITLHREALCHSPRGHSLRDYILNDLANALWRYCQLQGKPKDIDEVIVFHREALDLRPPGHPRRDNSLINLGNVLCTRYEQRGNTLDLDEAIVLYRECLTLRPLGHPQRDNPLHSLGAALLTSFTQQMNASALDEAVLLLRIAVSLRPPGHPHRHFSLNDLATCLSICYEQRGNEVDLNEAITLYREALSLYPPRHRRDDGSLDNLGYALRTSYEQRGVASDLDEAIALHRQSLHLRLPGHPKRDYSLHNLGIALLTQYTQTQNASDLDEAITFHQAALHLRPPGHPLRGPSLNSLANALRARYEHEGSVFDLDEAITLHREAASLCILGHPRRGAYLTTLGDGLKMRYMREKHKSDLDEAITNYWAALIDYPLGHPLREASLCNLSAVLHLRYEDEYVDDLSELTILGRLGGAAQPPRFESVEFPSLATFVTCNSRVFASQQSHYLHQVYFAE